MSGHWTDELFIKHGEIFLLFLEKDLPQAGSEVEALTKIFSEFSVPAGSRVLDVCCGIGRHSIGLALKGFDVTGVDISRLSIERAKERARENGVENKTSFIQGDIRKILDVLSPIGKKFNAVINMGTSIGYWTDEADRTILRQLHRLAELDCLLIIDITNRDYVVRHFQPFGISVVEGKPTYIRTEERKLMLETSRMENIWTFYRKDRDDLKHAATILLNHRLYCLHELVSLLKETGWSYLRSYGGLSLEPVTPDAHGIVIVGRKV